MIYSAMGMTMPSALAAAMRCFFFFLRHGKRGISSAEGGGSGGVIVPWNAHVSNVGGDVASLGVAWGTHIGERGGGELISDRHHASTRM
jgi:hypothetical protein